MWEYVMFDAEKMKICYVRSKIEEWKEIEGLETNFSFMRRYRKV